jgi:phage terminase small subunit
MTGRPKPPPKPKPPKAKAPAHLQPATRAWFSHVVQDYVLELHHLRLLQLCAEAWDRCAQSREVLDREGLTFIDRWGCPRARPEVSVERDSRIAFARLLRELDLDIEPPPQPGRPPALHSNR